MPIPTLLAALALGAAPCTLAPTTLPDTPLRRALERANAAELAAVQAGDATRAASHYTADALLLPPDGSVVRGRDAIRAFWAAGAGTEITQVVTVTESAGGDGGTAWLAGRYCLASRPRGSAVDPKAAYGTFLLVFRREGDAWRVVQDAWSAAP